MNRYTLRCSLTGEGLTVLVCDKHAKEMPLVDGDSVTAEPADEGCDCEFCADAPTLKNWEPGNFTEAL